MRAVVFDFDGLLCDTETLHYATWRELFADHGVELALEWWQQLVGTVGGPSLFDHLEALVGEPVDREALGREGRARFHALVDAAPVCDGVEAWLDEAAELGLAVGLATSSGRAWTARHLPRLGLAHRFDVVCTRDDVAAVKPAPDLYLAATAGLGVAPDAAVAVEDSLNGVRAAAAAGMACVAVPNDITRSLDLSAADLVLDSLASHRLVDVLGQLSR